MNKDKQTEIVEFAKDLSELSCTDKCVNCTHFYNKYEVGCVDMNFAEKLYANGYRKASDVAREIFAEIERALNLSKCYGDSGIYFEKDIETDIAELKKKYESEGNK